MLYMFYFVILGVSAQLGTAVNSTFWPCTNVTPQQDVNLNKLEGRWFLIETISPQPTTWLENICKGTEFYDIQENRLTMSMFEHVLGGNASFSNYTVNVVDSSLAVWDIPGLWSGAVIPYISDTTLALTICYRGLHYDWTGVFVKPLNSQLNTEDVINSLKSAGLQNVDTAGEQNITVCSTLGYH